MHPLTMACHALAMGLAEDDIDDREKTIREWREKGGTGILHTDAEETLRQLREMDLLND